VATLKQIFDKLLDAVSAPTLSAIALKVTDITPPVLKDIKEVNRTDLFDNSDKAFIDSFAHDTAIADEIAFEIVEDFNS
jgi:hypothetical protein